MTELDGDDLAALVARLETACCFHDLLERHAKEHPDRMAVEDDTSVLTYGDLWARGRRLAAYLVASGLQAGDRIALLAKNDVAFIDLTLAASMTGLVLVPLNYRLAPPEIDFIVQDSRAKLLFAGAGLLEMARAAQTQSATCDAVVEISADGTYGGRTTPELPDFALAETGAAVLFQMYTSGTTGNPKGALLTHDNILALCRNGTRYLGPFSAASRSLVCMPLFHVAGNAWLFFGLAAGCANTLVVDIDPPRLVETIASKEISCTLMVPAVIQMLILAAEAQEQTILGLKTLTFGASPMPAELLRRATVVFPDTEFLHVYGMTETTCMFCGLDPAELRAGRRLESCGKPFPDAVLKIVDAEGSDVAPGVIGEIVCRTPQLTSGYWGRPEATAQAIRDGWYYTGDAGYLDDEGFLFIRDRIKDMLISGGENVYPAEVENAVLAHPAVAEVAVIGVPDATWGEVGLAAVVLKPGAEAPAEEIKDVVRARLAGFKVPHHVEYIPALPRNGAGKVTKDVLRQTFAKG